MAEATPPQSPQFFPRGAVAFFGALVVSYAAIWLGVYALLIARSGR